MKHILMIALLLTASSLLLGQWHIEEGFEGITTLPAGWTIFDDGDGMTWRNLSHANAHTGSRAAFVDNYLPNENADWLVTPQITVSPGDSLIFFTRSWVSTEDLKVFVSTAAPNPSALNQLLVHLTNIGTQYQQVSLSLNQWAGQSIYLGFYWECNTYGILVDDIKIGQPLNVTPELDLPQSISFFESDTYTLDLIPHIVCTDLAHTSIAAAPNPNLNVSVSGLDLVLSSNGFTGSTQLYVTLTDLLNNLSAADSMEVLVLSDPAVDLYVSQVLAPRVYEFVGMPFTPQVRVINLGTSSFNDQIEISLSIYDNNGSPVHSDIAIQNVDLGPQQSTDLLFPLDFTPQSEGTFSYNLTINTPDGNPGNNQTQASFSILNRITLGGPDAFGYRFLDSNNPLGPEYEWTDISQTGTSTISYGVNGWGGDDNFSEPIPLGFNFPFYGSSYDQAYVDINGEILLAPNTWYNAYPGLNWDNDGNMFNYMYPIPGYTQMPGLIAVYWDDLHADEGTGNIYYQTFGEAPDRYTVFQWHNLRFHAGTGGTPQLKFQAILFEDGNIKLQYHTVATGQTGASVPHDNGFSATVAIQNQAANAGLPYLREIVQNSQYQGIEPAGNVLHPQLAVLFYAGTDQQAPIITHRPMGNTLNQNLELVARIIDMSALPTTHLHYNTGAGWQVLSPQSIQQNDYYFMLTDLPLGSTVQYYFEAQDALGNLAKLPQTAPVEVYSFKVLPTAGAQVLIAYSGTQDYERIELPLYEDLMAQLQIPYDIYNWEEYPSYSFPAQYQGILAYASTGTVSAKMYYFATALSDFLDLGTQSSPKNLWFASDGLASNQHAHPNSSSIRRMMSGYFRTHYVASGLGGGSNGLGGPDSFSYEHGTIKALPGTQVGMNGEEYPVYANSPDCIFPNDAAGDPYYDEVPYPAIGAIYNYAFEDGPFGGQAYLYHGVCATQVDTPSYRTMYFSFDLSQLTSAAHRLEWMSDLMDWWDVGPVSNEDPHIPALRTGIDSVFPNPFNPSTTIRYSLDSAQALDLAIYNLKGQRVKTLARDLKNAGTHSAVWNGLDDSGRPVSSGVYLLRLNTKARQQTQKITIIK